LAGTVEMTRSKARDCADGMHSTAHGEYTASAVALAYGISDCTHKYTSLRVNRRYPRWYCKVKFIVTDFLDIIIVILI
jgi:hypothetical protein